MTKYLSTPTNAVLVAIDMSKHRQEVLIERPEGGRRRRMSVMATKDDYDRTATHQSLDCPPSLVERGQPEELPRAFIAST